MEMRWRCTIIEMVDNGSGKDNGRKAWWRRSGTVRMDMAVEEMCDSNI